MPEEGDPHGAEARANRHVDGTAPGPWYFATLVTPCPYCYAGPGDLCRQKLGGERQTFHRERYELARTLANRPIKRRERKSTR